MPPFPRSRCQAFLSRLSIVVALSPLLAGCTADPSQFLPHVTSLGGAVMANPQLVTITFANDDARPALEAYAQWIVHSQWLAAVGAEYGIGSGSVLGVSERTDNAPVRITDDEIVSLIAAGIADGSIPQPANHDLSNVLFAIHFPASSTVLLSNAQHSAQSCLSFLGYHDSARRNGIEFSYAVVIDCPGSGVILDDLQTRELALSHEFIEAATDPLPGPNPAFRIDDRTNAWSAVGGEVGDLCITSEGLSVWNEGDFVAQRSWSNRAALNHSDPCVPSLPQSVYYTVVPTPRALQRVLPGETLHYSLRGWSTGTIGNWSLSAELVAPFMPIITVSNAIMNDGRTSTLDITIPITATPGPSVLFLKSSFSETEFRTWPLVVVVGGACASFTDCASCTRSFGCGWCGTSGRCEIAAATGSADSMCRGADWLLTATMCDNGCASHGASCTECASQEGCGWCATSTGNHCLATSDDSATSRDGSCSGAAWSGQQSYCP